jgi:hypothetical protein
LARTLQRCVTARLRTLCGVPGTSYGSLAADFPLFILRTVGLAAPLKDAAVFETVCGVAASSLLSLALSLTSLPLPSLLSLSAPSSSDSDPIYGCVSLMTLDRDVKWEQMYPRLNNTQDSAYIFCTSSRHPCGRRTD